MPGKGSVNIDHMRGFVQSESSYRALYGHLLCGNYEAGLRGGLTRRDSYAKRGIMFGHDRPSPRWFVWLNQENKLMKSSHITFECEAKLLNIAGELKTGELSDDEGGPGTERNTGTTVMVWVENKRTRPCQRAPLRKMDCAGPAD